MSRSARPIAVSSLSFSKNSTLRSELEAEFSDVRFNETGKLIEGSELVAFLSGAELAIVGTETIDREVLEATTLRGLIKYGVGLDNVDEVALEETGIPLGWTGGVNAGPVAEHTLGLILMLLRNLASGSRRLAGGEWKKDGGDSLFGKRVGIVGVGHVGRALIDLLRPFKCELWVNDLLDSSPDQKSLYERVGAKAVSKDEIWQSCDVVSIHTSLTPETEHLVDSKVLCQMRSHAILINTARGRICDNAALANALKAGEIRGAGIDVFESEPAPLPELLRCPNLVATPHIAGNSVEAVLAMGRSAIEHAVRLA